MATISLCMIVKNEEKNLERCLNSVKELVDEIIIVDTGSSDKTKEIASKFTDKVYDFEWVDDFSKARNFSLSKANCDWILILDADEAISKQDFEEIKKMVNDEKEADAFTLIQRNYLNGMGLAGFVSSDKDKYHESKTAFGFQPVEIVRLFKNKNYLFEGRIHETIYNSVKSKNGKIFGSDIAIHHFGNLGDKESNKNEVYVNLLKKRLNEREFGEKTEDFICFEIARELMVLKNYDEAKTYFEKASKINEKPEYLLGISGIYLINNDLYNAEKILKKAVELDGSNPDIHNNLGVIYSEKKEYKKAIKKFERAIELNPKSADAFYNLGLVYTRMGKNNEAKYYYNKAIELNPMYKEKIN
jgi:tetratricopeptide (TPR) repeat protein